MRVVARFCVGARARARGRVAVYHLGSWPGKTERGGGVIELAARSEIDSRRLD